MAGSLVSVCSCYCFIIHSKILFKIKNYKWIHFFALGITPDVLPKQEEKTEIVGKATPVQTTTIISNTTPKQSPKQSTAGSVRPGITEEISNATEGMPVSKEQKENVGHVALIAIVVVIVICSVLSGVSGVR